MALIVKRNLGPLGKDLVPRRNSKNNGNANFECQPNALNTEYIIEPRRECEFRVPAMELKCRIHYRTTAGMRISSAIKGDWN